MDELLNFFGSFFPKKSQINEIEALNNITNIKNISSGAILEREEKYIFQSLSVNLEYIKSKLNYSINSDISIKEFNIHVQSREFKAFLVYIDGLIDNKLLYDFVVKPLTEKNNGEQDNSGDASGIRIVNSGVANNISVRRVKRFDLETYIYNLLMPQNTLAKISEFRKVVSNVCRGKCVLFIDTIDTAFSLDLKFCNMENTYRYEFSHLIRNNTSTIRNLICNQNLIVEESTIGSITNTTIAICYLKDLVNTEILEEVKFKIRNSKVNSVLSDYDLRPVLKDKHSASKRILCANNPHKIVRSILNGKIVIFINGTTYALIVPNTYSKVSVHKKPLKNVALLVTAFFTLVFSSYFTAYANVRSIETSSSYVLTDTENIWKGLISNTLKEEIITVPNPYDNSSPLNVKISKNRNTVNTVKLVNDSPLITTNIYLSVQISNINSNLSFLESDLKQYVNGYIKEQISDYLYKTARQFNYDINGFENSLNKKDLEQINWNESYRNSFFELNCSLL